MLGAAAVVSLKPLFKVETDQRTDFLIKNCYSHPPEHFYEHLVVSDSNAVIQPWAVMVKLLNASVALLAVLGMLEDMCLAYIAKILILVDIEPDHIIAPQLCLSFQVDRFICGVLYGCFIGILYHTNHQNHIESS